MDRSAAAADHEGMKHFMLSLIFTTGFAFADSKADAEAAISSAAAACRAQQIGCTVSTSYTETGWLWKNGVPVNSTTVVIKATVEAPKPTPSPTVVVVVSPTVFPLSSVGK